ncbi:GGDEF domain-containing protein [Colwellia sp. 12G3]|uniref:GGDEF domain-containing protein n=1 Tax=Colwellia sp. 12G3 TaxID=2058299 RepID=UPI0012FEB089|nr:GGDEF domain-containing protein [Colwellia sp. 12G3]
MSNEDYSIFESVIHITEERDKRSLEKALIETISEFIDFDELILLRLPRNSNSEYLEAAVSIPESTVENKLIFIPHEYGDQRVLYDEEIALCIDSKATISSKENMVLRSLFPIIVNNKVSGILDIYGYQKTDITLKLISGFIRIYSNFQAIIDDNEHDTLTGLLNRKTFDAQLSGLLSISPSKSSPIKTKVKECRSAKVNSHHWIGILDIDFFKNINDKYGHVYGDEVLLLFAGLMKKSFRSNDFLFRYGGEEFVVVLTSVSDSDALKIFERFRCQLEAFNFPQVGKVTVSAGILKIAIEEHLTTIMERADKALYYSKEHGRNQVRDYNKLIEKGLLTNQSVESDIELF